MVGKTPKRCRRSVNTQPSGRKIPKIQVELPLHLVVYQILTRLPVKTLSRFLSVSKSLRSFIYDSHFQKLHARRSQQTPLLLIAKSDTTGVHFSTQTIYGEKLLKDFSISLPSQRFIPHVFSLVQTCLGLVCLRTNRNGSLLIFNPSTGEVITLPECPDQVFDLCVGFYYTYLSDEFKVVRYCTRHLYGYENAKDIDGRMDLHNEICFSEVFTLGSSAWRETRTPPPFKPSMFKHLPLVHGALHFLPSLYYHKDTRADHYIAAFDVHNEKYRGIPLPEIYIGFEATNNINQCDMAELRGSLCMGFNFFKSKKLLQLWFLKDYHGGKWVKERNIKLSYEPQLSFAFAFTGGSRVLLNVRTSEKERKLCYYNAQKKCTAKTLEINCSAMFYIDSFMPLPLGNRWRRINLRSKIMLIRMED